jgi:hypothetical protein
MVPVRRHLQDAITRLKATLLDQGRDGLIGRLGKTRRDRREVREVGIVEEFGWAVGQLEEAAPTAQQDR